MNRKLMRTLAKVIAAAGWADNKLTSDEMELLFAVANADGHVSDDEKLEITYLADYFLLSKSRVDQAFLKVTGSQSSLLPTRTRPASK